MICVAEGAEALGPGGKFAVESVATLAWNRWQFYRGIGGKFAVESVVTFTWNRWQVCRGIGGNFGVEYAIAYTFQPKKPSLGLWRGEPGLPMVV